MIVGTMIDLRPVRPADFASLRQWERDPEVARWMTTLTAALDPHESAEQEFDRLLRTPRVKLLAIQTKSGELAGFLRLNDLDYVARKATLRVFLAPEMQGRGYGTDALRHLVRFCFEQLGLHRLGLVVRADNARATHVYQRLGFVVEGREREAAWVDGQWVDFLHMGVLATDLSGGAA